MEHTSGPISLCRRGNLTYFPVVPGSAEFSLQVRRFLLEERPSVVAVELPSSLEAEYRAALDRMPAMSVILLSRGSVYDEEEAPVYIPVEPADPFVEAIRTARELAAEIVLVEPATEDKPHIPSAYPAPCSSEIIGIDTYIEAYRIQQQPRTQEVEQHAAALAWRLQGADPLASTAVILSLNMLDAVLDAMEVPQEQPVSLPTRLFKNSRLFNLHPDCLAEVTSEIPYYQERYNQARESAFTNHLLEKQKWQLALLREAEAEYEIQTGDNMRPWHRLALAKFGRNLALLGHDLLPGIYDLTLAARSVVDDNFAYEVWQTANRYSVQAAEDPDLQTLNISGEEVWIETRKIRLRRRLPRMKQRMKPSALSKRKIENKKGDWAKATSGASICSYPPEDLVIENYGRFLKQYAKNLISEEQSRVEPFMASTRDGLELRETIRNWHQGKLFVREMGKFSAEIGALVIIFDATRDERYPYLTTWLGEHQNESDMAFYSTEPFEHLVGPGVGRAEYGGLLMTLPPGRLYDIWGDYDYETAETKAERLLMAAIDYSIEKHVVYVAPKPPRSVFRQLAARSNRKISYIPLGQLSPSKLKKIRIVHVLDSHARRQDAGQYIW